MANQNEYLERTPEAIENLIEASRELMDAVELINNIRGLEDGSLSLVRGVKDPRTHNAGGVLSLYNQFLSLMRSYNRVATTIGTGYEIRVTKEGRTRTFSIEPEIISHIDGRLTYGRNAISGLVNIYRSEIEEYLERGRQLIAG
mgnify:CR=1 FL=1